METESLIDLSIDEVSIGERFRKDLGDIDSLARSIQEIGLLHPIVIDENRQLIAGARRIEAFRKLGRKTIPAYIVDLKELSKGEFHENAVRKDFTISEIVEIKRTLEPKISAEAEERMKAGKPRADSAQGKTRDIIADYVGVGHDTLQKAEAIVEAAERSPEIFQSILERVDAGKTSVHYAAKMVKRYEAAQDFPEMPDGVFSIIYADPPWQYDLAFAGSPDAHYVTLPTDKICNLTVPSHEDAALFLWTTNPFLEDALRVMREWGFEYKTNVVWVKDRPGTGYYVRGQHELLLIGIKGSIGVPAESNRPSSVIIAPKGAHSEKPEEAYKLIESMYPNQRYLELFARKQREGWTSWGLET